MAVHNASGPGLLDSLGTALHTRAEVGDDGRIHLTYDAKHELPELPETPLQPQEAPIDRGKPPHPPALNILILIVGSRGDVQPFLALGQQLKRAIHRVRIGTHATFADFVRESELEFFTIGGDPKVKNPGLMPSIDSLMAGDVKRKQQMVAEILEGSYKATFGPDEVTQEPFAADLVIANPPTFAHVHLAEKLGVPLHMIFTMPWSPTSSFAHPLVSIKASNAEPRLGKYLSYAVVDILTWQGLGSSINDFRTKTLGLQRLTTQSGTGILERTLAPYTYCFSPSLIPKPPDWPAYIDCSGFFFLPLGDSYTPPDDLAAFLKAGEKPIYIGFGSVPVKDAKAMTTTIFQAVASTGVRALVSAGWGSLGGDSVPDNVFILGNVPHDWLFQHVSTVVHHGGCGTVAIGVRLGLPTVVVPFFGDQPFWGEMIERAGAGPAPIPADTLNATNLAEALRFCMTDEAQAAAKVLGEKIRHEDGVKTAVESIHRQLPLHNMRCDLEPSLKAVWWSDRYCLRLSPLAGQVLADVKFIDLDKLELHRPKEWLTRAPVNDPVSGGAVAIFKTVTNYQLGIASIFLNPPKGIVKTTLAIPQGLANIVTSVSEGIRNAPKLYGSSVRPVGPITDFESGMREGGKGLAYGYLDAATGFFTEPYEGAKKEGPIGAVKGLVRGGINAGMRPAAGVLGLIEHTATGVVQSVKKTLRHREEAARFAARRHEGSTPATEEQRRSVLETFERLKDGAADRRARYKREAEEIAGPLVAAGLQPRPGDDM